MRMEMKQEQQTGYINIYFYGCLCLDFWHPKIWLNLCYILMKISRNICKTGVLHRRVLRSQQHHSEKYYLMGCDAMYSSTSLLTYFDIQDGIISVAVPKPSEFGN
jgi:hypothetical protein